MKTFGIIGLRTEHKTISAEEYKAAYFAVAMQMAKGRQPYSQLTNSCVTNVRPILSAAGYNAPQY